ncbi:MAG: hypothetical protein NVS2B8_07750 [Vulcanimicrobiaceae bacterium]
MLRALLERFDGAVKHRRVGSHAVPVRDFVHLEPMRRIDLVRTHELAEPVAENFGTAAVDVIESRLAQTAEDLVVRQPMPTRHIIDLGRREQRQLDVRQRLFKSAHER